MNQEANGQERDRRLGTANVRWDLTPMYQGLDDPQLGSDVKDLERLAKLFHDSH